MKLINGYYTDDNNNRWDSTIYSERRSIELSKTLINCYDCVNCNYCNSCNSCNSCDYCESCDYCDSCDYCNSCNYCNYCNYCDYCKLCRNFKENPQRYSTKKLGRDNRNTTFYFNDKEVQVICGCFRGNLKEFEKAVKKTHGNNKHGIDYMREIKKVKYLIKNI